MRGHNVVPIRLVECIEGFLLVLHSSEIGRRLMEIFKYLCGVGGMNGIFGMHIAVVIHGFECYICKHTTIS